MAYALGMCRIKIRQVSCRNPIRKKQIYLLNGAKAVKMGLVMEGLYRGTTIFSTEVEIIVLIMKLTQFI